MASGGARNRSGPQPDPGSLRSYKRGLSARVLPAEGFKGRPPKFPLPSVPVFDVYFADGQRVKEFDERATKAREARELALWRWAWRTPQAAAWAGESWRWPSVAMWVRTHVVCESEDATAADKNSLHRFADQIGLTPAGLRENGWSVAADEVADRRSSRPMPAPAGSARDRLKALDGGGA